MGRFTGASLQVSVAERRDQPTCRRAKGAGGEGDGALARAARRGVRLQVELRLAPRHDEQVGRLLIDSQTLGSVDPSRGARSGSGAPRRAAAPRARTRRSARAGPTPASSRVLLRPLARARRLAAAGPGRGGPEAASSRPGGGAPAGRRRGRVGDVSDTRRRDAPRDRARGGRTSSHSAMFGGASAASLVRVRTSSR